MKNTTRKMSLARETLRHLRPDEMANAHGGGTKKASVCRICESMSAVCVCPSDDCDPIGTAGPLG